MIAIIDYGVGNLFSLKCSLDAVGAPSVVTGDPEEIKSADKLILPGVGAFRDAVRKLRDTGLFSLVQEEGHSGKPLLGICLGMQMLFERSLEGGVYGGLGLLKGEVRPIAPVIGEGLKVPHIGWNALHFVRPCELFRNTTEGTEVYFVHSYAAMDAPDETAVTEYGAMLTAAVSRGNLFGCQFHPEKSGRAGLEILRTFAKEIR